MEITDTVQLGSFQERKDSFLNGEIPRITCNTQEERDEILEASGAKLMAIDQADIEKTQTTACRPTTRKDISVEEIKDSSNKIPQTYWYIYKTETNDN
jgi:hypothetical protein